MELVRWTTPSIYFEPSAVEISDIEEIILVISQGGDAVITKTKDDALLTENQFMWTLSQEETGLLSNKQQAYLKIDYLTDGGVRYAVRQRSCIVSDSAVNEVIS